jgi:CII-binding regulator of phage lambda lysogenization HflD
MQHAVHVSELTRTLAKLEGRMVKRERIIEEKGNEIETLQKKIQHLEEVSNFLLSHCHMFCGILTGI